MNNFMSELDGVGRLLKRQGAGLHAEVSVRDVKGVLNVHARHRVGCMSLGTR